eukprot:TRINITY_DN5717_c0_g1_i3.p1 TRINITY_DN5717_c0_g1~~TRINITY_DN5717_c0_g1_i3.p1  ORF type:complete len:462 (+),score=36.47 TRINITY_DN5717_c0_g1_i3:373-1758(+)
MYRLKNIDSNLNDIDEYFEPQLMSKEHSTINDLLNSVIFPERIPESKYEVHHACESVITQLMKISHFSTIYNIFAGILIIAMSNIVVNNYLENSGILDISLFLWCFGNITYAVCIWFVLFIGSWFAFGLQYLISFGFLSRKIAYTVYYTLLSLVLYYVPSVITYYELPPASAAFVSCELVRLAMKNHSFLMVNRDLHKDKVNNVSDRNVEYYPKNVNWKNYWLFLWVPTLIYQPKYPRTNRIRIGFVIKMFLDAFLSLAMVYAIFVAYCVPMFPFFTKDFKTLMLAVFKVMIPSLLFSILGFFGLLHSWLNAFAELTRFADRRFYTDWWNSTNWAQYYRRWNTVVHNFLKTHLFMVLYEDFRFTKGSSMWLTFIASAIVHEYIVAIALGFYKPILLIMFLLPGVLFIYLTKLFVGWRGWNIFMWTMLIIGHGTLLGLYYRAWYRHYYTDIVDPWYYGIIYV